MSGLGSLWAAVRLRTTVHRYAMRVLDDLGHAPVMPPGTAIGIRTATVGLDPLRVLVFSGGLAVAYGVASREEAFDRPLVELLSTATRRGVSLENRAVQHVRTADAVDSLGPSGAHTYHVAVWCPSFAEGLERLSARGWRRDLTQMIQDLRRDRRVPLVLTHMPVPIGRHPAALLARPWVHRLNRAIDAVAAQHDDVVAVATESFVAREIGRPVTSREYFAAVAGRIAPAVLEVLRLRDLAPATGVLPPVAAAR